MNGTKMNDSCLLEMDQSLTESLGRNSSILVFGRTSVTEIYLAYNLAKIVRLGDDGQTFGFRRMS